VGPTSAGLSLLHPSRATAVHAIVVSEEPVAILMYIPITSAHRRATAQRSHSVAWVAAESCDAPSYDSESNYALNRNDYPVNFVSWDKAQQFAAWVGARLPSESEWELVNRATNRPPQKL
jgi:formylglycine-generating enzyme required for sulfatase activity